MRTVEIDGITRNIVLGRFTQDALPTAMWNVQFIIKEVGTGKDVFIWEESGHGFFPYNFETFWDCLSIPYEGGDD